MGPFSDSIVVSLAVYVTIKRDRIMQIASGLSMIKEIPSGSNDTGDIADSPSLSFFLIVTCQRIASQFESRVMLWLEEATIYCLSTKTIMATTILLIGRVRWIRRR